jgi:hypothetical protein
MRPQTIGLTWRKTRPNTLSVSSLNIDGLVLSVVDLHELPGHGLLALSRCLEARLSVEGALERSRETRRLQQSQTLDQGSALLCERPRTVVVSKPSDDQTRASETTDDRGGAG